MSAAYEAGAFFPASYLPSTVTPIYGIALNSFINRTPLFTRLPRGPLESLSFKTSTVLFRPSTQVLNNGGTVGSGDTTFVVTDASVYQVHDTIEIGSEEMLITGIVVSTNTLTVVRGFAGTSAASHTDGGTIYLNSNSRTGGEINVTGVSRIPTAVTQWAQVHQFPWHVGGSMASNTAFALPPGVQSVVGRERMMAIQNCSDDVERAYYYGRVNAIVNDGDTPQQAGLRTLIVTNNTTSPTNATSYEPTDLIRDTVTKINAAGGDATHLIVSLDWSTGFAKWTFPLVRLVDAGTTEFGVNVNRFQCPFLPAGMEVIMAPLLRPGTAICLSGAEVRQRIKRLMFDKPRGSQGDADQGDIIHEARSSWTTKHITPGCPASPAGHSRADRKDVTHHGNVCLSGNGRIRRDRQRGFGEAAGLRGGQTGQVAAGHVAAAKRAVRRGRRPGRRRARLRPAGGSRSVPHVAVSGLRIRRQRTDGRTASDGHAGGQRRNGELTVAEPQTSLEWWAAEAARVVAAKVADARRTQGKPSRPH